MSIRAPARCYREAAAAPADRGFAILLDGKTVLTPARAGLVLPCAGLAEAVTEEWRAQGVKLAPATMPLTRLAYTALDRVAPQREHLAAETIRFAANDLLCYRASAPPDLAARQSEQWNPLLDWLSETYGAPLRTGAGLAFVAQDEAALAKLREAVARLDAFALAGVQAAAALTGSLVLALALHRGRVDAEAAFAAAHLDELYQAEMWGEDAEAKARLQARASDLRAIARFLSLLRQG